MSIDKEVRTPVRRLILAAAIPVALLIPAGTAQAWDRNPPPGSTICVPAPGGFIIVPNAQPPYPEGSHESEGGACEGPVVQPPAAPVETTPVVPTPPAPQPEAPPVAPQPPAPVVTPPSTVNQPPVRETPRRQTPDRADRDQPRRPVENRPAEAQPTPQTVNSDELTRNGELAYTGLDAGWIMVIGVGLIAIGIGVRLLTRKPKTPSEPPQMWGGDVR